MTPERYRFVLVAIEQVHFSTRVGGGRKPPKSSLDSDKDAGQEP